MPPSPLAHAWTPLPIELSRSEPIRFQETVAGAVTPGPGQQGSATGSGLVNHGSVLAVWLLWVPPTPRRPWWRRGGNISQAGWALLSVDSGPRGRGQKGKAPRSRPFEGLARSLLRSSSGWGESTISSKLRGRAPLPPGKGEQAVRGTRVKSEISNPWLFLRPEKQKCGSCQG